MCDLVPKKTQTYRHDMVTDWVSTETIRENTRPPENNYKKFLKKQERTDAKRTEKKRKEEDNATCWKKRRKKNKKTRNKNKPATKTVKWEKKFVSRLLIHIIFSVD